MAFHPISIRNLVCEVSSLHHHVNYPRGLGGRPGSRSLWECRLWKYARRYASVEVVRFTLTLEVLLEDWIGSRML